MTSPYEGIPEGDASSGGQLRDRVLPAGLLASVTGLVNLGERNLPLGVDQEGSAQCHARLLVEDPVGLRRGAVRPEVGEQREIEALLLAEGLEAEHRVRADRQDLHACVGVGGQLVTELAQLTCADPGEGKGVEDQQDRGAPQIREGDELLVLVGKAEVGGAIADGEAHAPIVPQRRLRAAFGVTSRMPDQSLAAEMLLVCCSPAVGATSVTSPGSTCPGRPDLGTSSHTTPSSASEVSASVRASKRSPSSSRHQSRTTSATSSVSSSTISLPAASTMESRRSSSASSSQPSSCTTMPGLIPNRAARLALPESTLIPAAPPWNGPLLTGCLRHDAVGRRNGAPPEYPARDDGSRASARGRGEDGGGGHDQREGCPHPGHVTPLVLIAPGVPGLALAEA